MGSISKRIAAVIIGIAIFSIVLAQSPAEVSRGISGRINETSAGSDIAVGGNVTALNLSVVLSTNKWQGYFGNVSGTLGLGLGNDIFYNFSLSTVKAIYATTNSSFAFGNIEAGAAAALDTVWGFTTASDSDQAIDIYTGLTSVEGVVAPSAELEPKNLEWNSTIMDSGPSTFKGCFAFGANVQPAGDTCFDGSICQYELLVPAGGSGDTYYFYLSLG
jgi:hypothetical protein